MTTINKNDILDFSNIVKSNSIRMQAYNQLLIWAETDIQKVQDNSKGCIVLQGYATPADYARNPGLKEKAEKAIAIINAQTEGCSSKGNTNPFNIDYQRCYKYLLIYLVSKDTKYADKIISIFKQWSSNCKKIIGGNSALECSWVLTGYGRVQEILMYTYTNGWKKSNIESDWNKFIDDLVLPPIINTMYKNNKIAGPGGQNWKTSANLARLMYSKVRQDKKQFNLCIKNAYICFDQLFGKYTSGQTIETSRDIGHAQMGLGGMAQMCEILFNHGIDLYSN